MSTKTHMSLKTKKILAGVGIVFGTLLVFLISFILSFSLIVNPISFIPASDADAAKENAELKEQVQTLTDEIEMLNTTVDKYKASSSAPAIVVTPDPQPQQPAPKPDTPGTQTEASATDSNTAQNSEDAATEVFSPDTVTSTNEETPEDVEVPITIIDISE
ncbi:MAG: hypothetical protein Q4A86_00545 [Clostridia bacterium]|nr:hypothetical protein [Clostridia bacterium]